MFEGIFSVNLHVNYASDNDAQINISKTYQQSKSVNSIINPDTKSFSSIVNPDENVPLYLEEILSKLKAELLSIIGSDQIRKIVHYDNSGTPVIVFYLKNHKYCNNVKKCHTNNNVYFVYQINKKSLYQKCMKCVTYSSDVLAVL